MKQKNKVKKAISDFAKRGGNFGMLTSTQSLKIGRKKITVKSHKPGAWIGKDGKRLLNLINYIENTTGVRYKIEVKGGDIFNY